MLPKLNLVLVVFMGICFAMPFAAVSCSGYRVAEATGYQLAIGADTSNVMTGIGNDLMKAASPAKSTPQQLPMQPAAAAAFALALIAALIALSALGKAESRAIAIYEATLFALAAIALYLLQSNMHRSFEKNEATIFFELQFLPGYWAALTTAALGALLNFLAVARVLTPRQTALTR